MATASFRPGKSDDTFRYRTHVMQRIGLERDLPQTTAAGIVLAFEIALEDQSVIAHHDDAMQVPHALVRDHLVKPRFKIRCEARFTGGDPLRTGGGCGTTVEPASKERHPRR